MNNLIKEAFKDTVIINKIKEKLPKLFHLAQLERSRAGKTGMEVGSLRERIIVALLIYKFGSENVFSDIPITESEVDVKVFNNPISIKTITGKSFSGVKLNWTVDPESVLKFKENYNPTCDMIFVRINWNNGGGFYYIPKKVQIDTFKSIGIENYIKLPKQGTNQRGVEITSKALKQIVINENTIQIPIEWKKEIVNFNAFDRWVELWQQD